MLFLTNEFVEFTLNSFSSTFLNVKGAPKGGISRLAKMRKPECTVVHEDFRIKRNAEIPLLGYPRRNSEGVRPVRFLNVVAKYSGFSNCRTSEISFIEADVPRSISFARWIRRSMKYWAGDSPVYSLKSLRNFVYPMFSRSAISGMLVFSSTASAMAFLAMSTSSFMPSSFLLRFRFPVMNMMPSR